MTCPECDGDELVFPVPASLADYLPDDRPYAAVCERCLHVAPADDGPDDLPDFRSVSDAFPADREAAAAVACLLAVLDRLVLYRSEADELAAAAERHGADVLLVLDRLAGDDGLDPHFDVRRRRRQLEQLI